MKELNINSQIELSNGTKIPIIGYGVFRIPEGNEVKNAVQYALSIGYRLIDTAMIYRNEEGVGKAIKDVDIDDNAFKKIEAIIFSMTLEERRNPDLINGKRRERLAKGSGNTIQDVNQFIKQFDQMKVMMKKFQGMGMTKK